MAGFVELLDETDRLFYSDITKITDGEWGIYIGIVCSGNMISEYKKSSLYFLFV